MENSEELFLMNTLKFWQSRTERKLTLEDAREITENVCTVFEILAAADTATGLNDAMEVAI